MTTIRLDDDYESIMLKSAYKDEFRYALRKGKVLEALSYVKNRNDIVKLVKDFGLTRSWVKKQAEEGVGIEFLERLKRNAGIVWFTAYLSGLDAVTREQSGLSRFVDQNDLNNYFGVLDSTNQYRVPSDVSEVSLYQLMACCDREIDFKIAESSFYYILIIFGMACDVEAMTKCLDMMYPNGISLEQSAINIREMWQLVHELDDPITVLLDQFFELPYELLARSGNIIEFRGVTGQIYQVDPSVKNRRSNRKPSTIYTEYGALFGLRLAPLLVDDGEEEYYDDGTTEFNRDGTLLYGGDLLPSMFYTSIANVPGIDGYFLAQELVRSGIDYQSYGLEIPEDLIEYWNTVIGVEYWNGVLDDTVILLSNGETFYNGVGSGLELVSESNSLSYDGYPILFMARDEQYFYLDFMAIPIDETIKQYQISILTPKPMTLLITVQYDGLVKVEHL